MASIAKPDHKNRQATKRPANNKNQKQPNHQTKQQTTTRMRTPNGAYAPHTPKQRETRSLMFCPFGAIGFSDEKPYLPQRLERQPLASWHDYRQPTPNPKENTKQRLTNIQYSYLNHILFSHQNWCRSRRSAPNRSTHKNNSKKSKL